MKFVDLYKFLEKKKYYVFSYADLFSIYPNETKDNVKKIVYRWKKTGLVAPLKKGLYELTYPEDLSIPDMYIASKLYSPSYVSLETALSRYSIIPEVSMAVTSITTKPTRKFKNKHGLFIYRTVKINCFIGYQTEKHAGFDIFIAEPEKALMDFIYFKSLHDKNYDFRDERFDKNIIAGLNKKKLNEYSRLYNIDLKEFYANL